MAKCTYCGQEMLEGVSCKPWPVLGHDAIPYGEEKRFATPDGSATTLAEVHGTSGHWPQNCHDCGTPPGGYHHPGCDMEECPNCGMQSLQDTDCYHKDEVERLERRVEMLAVALARRHLGEVSEIQVQEMLKTYDDDVEGTERFIEAMQ